jgi:uncharacterized protein
MATGGEQSGLVPVTARERLVVLDALRGFALLGIALMNIEFFTRPMQGVMLGFDPALRGADYSAGWAIMAFVQGKFWTLFSLLFGVGFGVMLQRADALRADPDFNRLYIRRLVALFAFGALHAALLWPGDILVPYAVAGFILLLMARTMQPGALWKLGLGLYLGPLLLVWGVALMISLAQLDPKAGAQIVGEFDKATAEVREAYAAAEAVYRDGSWVAVTVQRIRDTLTMYQYLPMMVPMILGMFMLGTWLLRTGRLHDIPAHRVFWRNLLLLGGPLGAVCAVFAMPPLLAGDMMVPTLPLAWGMTLMTLAGLLLCLAYAAAIVLAVAGPLPALGRLLGPVGRMALTNYLLQSLVFSTLFYGYGFGLWGQVPRAQQVLLVFAVFLAQILLSHLWLARFRYGPMEWLWRTLTYGRAPAMRA